MNLSTDRNVTRTRRDPGRAPFPYVVLLVGLGIVAIAFGWYAIESTNLDLPIDTRLEVVIVVSLIFSAAAVYLVSRFTVERIIILMVLTLPLVSSLVLDIGGTVRINYLFVLLAVFFALYTKRFRLSPREVPLKFLLAFALYSLISVTFTLLIPDLQSVTSSGFRGLPIRSLIQFGQLILMLMAFFVILNYATSEQRIGKLCTLIFWSLVIVVGYGTYEFLAAIFGMPFLNLDTAPTGTGYVLAPSAVDLARTFGEITLPRPHSTFPEPIDLSAYLLFSIPFAIVAIGLARKHIHMIFMLLFIIVSATFFVAVNSRAGFIAVALLIPILLILAPGWRARLQFGTAALATVLFAGFVLFPLAGAPMGLGAPMDFFEENFESLVSLEDARARSYDQPFEVFRQSPVWGVGIGNYPFYVLSSESARNEAVPTTGSLYTRILSELGLIGAVLFFGFVLGTLIGLVNVLKRSASPMLRRLALASLTAVIGMLVVKIGTVGIYTESHFWVAFAIAVAVIRLHRTEVRSTVNKPVITGTLPLTNSSI